MCRPKRVEAMPITEQSVDDGNDCHVLDEQVQSSTELPQTQSESSPAECTSNRPAQAQPSATRQRAFVLTIAYDGTNYFGWQRQPDQPTIQAHVETALTAVTQEHGIKAYASSRTDTGVHAIGQSVMFRSAAWKSTAENFGRALNTKLPSDIVVRGAREVPLSFHPLRDSKGKRYQYRIYCSRTNDPLQANTHWWIRRRLDISKMEVCCRYLRGKHDFASFETTGSPRKTTVRHVRDLKLNSDPHMDGMLLTIEIEADGFLYNMVRNIVGTLVHVGVGKEEPDWIFEVFKAKDRTAAGPTAPPQGLCLVEVLY